MRPLASDWRIMIRARIIKPTPTRESSRWAGLSSVIHFVSVVLGQDHPILLGFPTGSRDVDTLATAHVALCHLGRIVLTRSFNTLGPRGWMRVVAANENRRLAKRFCSSLPHRISGISGDPSPSWRLGGWGKLGADLVQISKSSNSPARRFSPPNEPTRPRSERVSTPQAR